MCSGRGTLHLALLPSKFQPIVFMSSLNPPQKSAVDTNRGALLGIGRCGDWENKGHYVSNREIDTVRRSTKPNPWRHVHQQSRHRNARAVGKADQLQGSREPTAAFDVPLALRPHSSPQYYSFRLSRKIWHLRAGRPGIVSP